MYGYVTFVRAQAQLISLRYDTDTSRMDTYDGGERLADRAHGERHPRAELRVHVRLAPRDEHQALHALEHPVRDRRVDRQDEPRPEAQPQTRYALLRDNLARNPEE